ncbi:MAG TPA: hypothetical protein VH916_05720 [Dehalococcoidia bacterium]|jgi:hypothetical protein
MYVSRLSFYTRPGQTDAVTQRLSRLAELVEAAGRARPRVLRVSMASPGAPDLQFEEQFATLADLETAMKSVMAATDFEDWSRGTSELLLQPPKREILTVE